MLGAHATLCNRSYRAMTSKPIRWSDVDENELRNILSQQAVPPVSVNIDILSKTICDTLYRCGSECRREVPDPVVDPEVSRWERLLQDQDDARVWRAVDWRGEITHERNVATPPSDDEFKNHLEIMLNPQGVNDSDLNEFLNLPTIPILDEPISVLEVQNQVRRLKPEKACGPDGVSPGILKVLPVQWLITITCLFNNVFLSGLYPKAWNVAKMFMVFKRGNRAEATNYRGISVINGIAKLYDMVLCARLYAWFTPYREQAGSQEKRGCLEHIVALRLLTDTAKRTKKKLFVCFIDFSQAYDRVPRDMLFKVLKRLGCGVVMVVALMAMYRVTHSVIGTALVTATVGVRQGSPTSCLLFVIFVNDLIKMIRENCEDDGFLSWLHCLVLMDDTVILATTRTGMTHKLRVMKNYCNLYGMKINKKKTKFFVINGCHTDCQTITIDDVEVNVCPKYVYLGSIFTSTGSVSDDIKSHADSKVCHILKFISFIKKNNDVPFYVKRKVFDAALMSSVLYGCESWLSGDLKPVMKLYHWGLKQLLGVRSTTCNDLCFLE